MISRFLYFIFSLLCITTSSGQDITRQKADSMLKVLVKNIPDTERIDLLLSMAQFHIFKPGEIQADLDSGMVYIKKAAALNATIKSIDASGYLLLTESFLTKEKGHPEEGREMAAKAVSILEKGKNKSYLGKAYYELSQYYNYADSTGLLVMIPLVEKAIVAFNQGGNMERKAFSLKMLGDLLNNDDKNEKAIEALKQSIDVYKSIHYPYLQEVYSLLGRVYGDQGNHKQSLLYGLLALKTAEDVKDSSMSLCEILNNLGVLYRDREQIEISNQYFKAGLEIAKKNNDSYTAILLISAVAAGYSTLSQPMEEINFLASVPKKFMLPGTDEEKVILYLTYLKAYLDAKEPDKAQRYCNLLLTLVDNNDFDTYLESTVYRVVARHYMQMKNYPLARKYLSKNNVFDNVTGSYRISLDLRSWYKLDSAEGNFKDAFYHLLRYKNISDSLFTVTKTKQFQELEVENEIEKKEDSIKQKDKDIATLTQTNNLHLANLKQANQIKNLTIAGIILAFAFIGLLYRQYRHKQKTNDVITNKNNLLQHLLTEKEWLLKEIHHRVKNNLQIVMSLLNSQSAYIDNAPALAAIHDSQHRVHAMSLIHQKLYTTENVSSINMSAYIRELATYLNDSFNTGQRIHFEYNIEPLELDVSQAVPLGLILNEAITNSIKYAFPDNRNGVINISLSKTASSHYLLYIADNGIGMPADAKNKKMGSLGLSLMAGLSEDLDGNFSIVNNNGTTIKISFVHHQNIKTQVV